MKPVLVIGILLGLTAVILGAFGAHGLRPRLTADQLTSFETGVRYQMFHALILMVIPMFLARAPSPLLGWAGGCIAVGVVLFSGSIYLLATRELTGLQAWSGLLGPITPLGGLSMIGGWCLLLVWAVFKT